MIQSGIDKACEKAIDKITKGDKQALSVIYDNMARIIFSVAYAITENYQDAEDVLQNTFIEIVKYAHTYSKGSNVKAWILAMSRHLAIDIVRKRKTVLSIDDKIDESLIICENTDFSNLEVFDMLKTLDDEQRQIILLRLYSELSYKAISKIMEISVASAQKKYQRALKKLREEFFK